jgi:hypothetical protein
MAITITDGYMDGEKQVSRLVEEQQSRDPVSFHKHCQKTVCSAFGYNGQGATWNILSDNTDAGNMNLTHIQSLLNSNETVRGFFSNNENNITEDLRSILELMDLLASKSINPIPKTLTFIEGNNQSTSIRVMGMDNDEEIDVSKP